MDVLTYKLIMCTIAAIFSYISVYNICVYLHIDEKNILRRMLDVKTHGYREKKSPIDTYAITRTNFRFEIFSRIFKNIKFADKIKSLLDQADIPWQVDTFIIFSIVLGIIPLILGLLFLPAIAILFPAALIAPYLYLKLKIKKRTTLFTQQLPDALDLLSNALRAGHSLFGGFEIIVNEMPDPISRVFKVLTDEIALGVDTKDAMRSLQEIIPGSIDLRFFTTVVILQREIGGNLIKLLEILAKTIRERFKMIGQLKAQTMQAKLSGVIVSLVPPVIATVLFFIAPEYMDYLINHPWGKAALGVSVFLMITGFIIIHKITDIDI